MTSEGFGRLTAAMMDRDNERVHVVIGDGKRPTPRKIEFSKRRTTERNNNTATAKPETADVDNSMNGNMFGKSSSKNMFGKSSSKGTPIEHTSKAPLTESRRASLGSTVLIEQPPTGDMSEVTVSMWGLPPEDTEGTEPQKGGQRPTSVTYERRTLDEHQASVEAGEAEQRIWVDTPTFSGPDRRHQSISPEVERRRSVPPRLKAGVRLEQERYLRLKLATMETDRSQQDLLTSALDEYLDQIGIDRFIRVAMGFGGAESSFDKGKKS